MRLTGIVNTYNEEENIYGCLDSIRWIDEIVVVDMYSTDNTVDIAKKFTNRVFLYPYTSYVEQARNFTLSKARGQWVLILDADERLEQKSKTIINNLIRKDDLDGFLFPRKNYVNTNYFLKHGYFYPDYQLRLFRNNQSIYYSGKIHEQPIINISKTQKIDNIHIIHNVSHSKYSSFASFKRFIPYIKVESEDLLSKKKSVLGFLVKGSIIIIEDFYRSFIKLEGYKDRYFGFRAALLYAIYKGSVYYYTAIKKLTRRYDH